MARSSEHRSLEISLEVRPVAADGSKAGEPQVALYRMGIHDEP